MIPLQLKSMSPRDFRDAVDAWLDLQRVKLELNYDKSVEERMLSVTQGCLKHLIKKKLTFLPYNIEVLIDQIDNIPSLEKLLDRVVRLKNPRVSTILRLLEKVHAIAE